jgi:hypothetical protein
LALLEKLEGRFNGHVFVLKPDEREILRTSSHLARFARLVEGRQEGSGQLTLWERYSFADLPVELISHIYQLFVKDTAVAVYTPHFVVRLMLSEVLSWDRLDRLEKNDEVILDGACGSGIFLAEAYKRLVLHWRYRTLGKFAKEQRDWDVGEGWIEGKKGKRVPVDHITGHPYLHSKFLTGHGVDEQGIERCKVTRFKSYYTKRRFTPPMLLIRSQSDFHHAIWEKHYPASDRIKLLPRESRRHSRDRTPPLMDTDEPNPSWSLLRRTDGSKYRAH